MTALVTAVLLSQPVLAQSLPVREQAHSVLAQSQPVDAKSQAEEAKSRPVGEQLPSTDARSLEQDASRTYERVTRTIDIGGMDVASPAGARRVYRQIVSTAKRICWSSPRGHKGVVRAKHRREHGMRCFDDAVTDALAQVTDRVGLDLEQVAGLDRFDEAGLIASR